MAVQILQAPSTQNVPCSGGTSIISFGRKARPTTHQMPPFRFQYALHPVTQVLCILESDDGGCGGGWGWEVIKVIRMDFKVSKDNKEKNPFYSPLWGLAVEVESPPLSPFPLRVAGRRAEEWETSRKRWEISEQEGAGEGQLGMEHGPPWEGDKEAPKVSNFPLKASPATRTELSGLSPAHYLSLGNFFYWHF